MNVVANTRIEDSLTDSRLLAPERYEELVGTLIPRCDDWAILGPELVYRGWLTAFQLQTITRGADQELILGSYILLELIAEGGMGRVYLARNWKLGTMAAVKVIRSDRAGDRVTVERFLREIETTSSLSHPNIVHVFDAGYESGKLFYAMEYLAGVDLGAVLQAQRFLPTEHACRYAYQVAEALRYISGFGLVHRDIKPSNVLITGDPTTAMLVDLGLARFEQPTELDGSAGLTRVGLMIGTPDYVSPEQIREPQSVDIRSDLYGLGCTLYHMLAGRPPFGHVASTPEKLFCQLSSEPTPIERLRPDVSRNLAAIVGRLLAKRPRDRVQEPAELLIALQQEFPIAGDTLVDGAGPTATGDRIVPIDDPLPATAEVPMQQISIWTPGAGAHLHDTSEMNLTGRPVRVPRLVWFLMAGIVGLLIGLVISQLMFTSVD